MVPLPWTLLLRELPDTGCSSGLSPWPHGLLQEVFPGESAPQGEDNEFSGSLVHVDSQGSKPCPPGCYLFPQEPLRKRSPTPITEAFVVSKFWNGEQLGMRLWGSGLNLEPGSSRTWQRQQSWWWWLGRRAACPEIRWL